MPTRCLFAIQELRFAIRVKCYKLLHMTRCTETRLDNAIRDPQNHVNEGHTLWCQGTQTEVAAGTQEETAQTTGPHKHVNEGHALWWQGARTEVAAGAQEEAAGALGALARDHAANQAAALAAGAIKPLLSLVSTGTPAVRVQPLTPENATDYNLLEW